MQDDSPGDRGRGMRIRATVLLTRHHAVLLVRERGGMWLLPGG
jgi:8-oxo-dGTP diphosphatase